MPSTRLLLALLSSALSLSPPQSGPRSPAPVSNWAMLDVRGLTKKYRNRAVADHVTFTVPPGQVTGYLGPNGSGESTSVKMLAGLLPSTSGQILWDGADIRHDLIAFKRCLV